MSVTSTYQIELVWTGNTGEGTKDTKSFERTHLIRSGDKPEIHGTSAVDKSGWNPEECMIASISSCHMLWYLHLCARNDIIAIDYLDHPIGKLEFEGSSGRFVHIELRPKVKILGPDKIELARQLHEIAHKYCYTANSVNFPVEVNPVIEEMK